MSSPENLIELLKQGEQVWNNWRQENPDQRLNINYADLKGLNLVQFDLRKVDLMNAQLQGTNLSNAQLQGVDLTGANLQNALIKNSDMTGGDLRGAIASGAIFEGSILKDCELMGTDFKNVNLSQVKGLTKRQIMEFISDETTQLPEVIEEEKAIEDVGAKLKFFPEY